MKLLLTISIVLIIVFIGWQLWFVLLINIKEPVYKLVEKKDGYEIRQYDPYLIAHTSLAGQYESVTNKGFNVLANFIFGGNNQKIRMPMTAPVFIEKKQDIDGYDIAFVMPASYNKETLPKPNNMQIQITHKPSTKVAAYRFTWYPSAKRVEAKTKEFKALLKRDGIKYSSEILLARYNPPFILPFLMRNELLVIIDK